jgi:hypothetical protein
MSKSKYISSRVVTTTIGNDGRTLVHREVTVACKRCPQPFTCVMTTKPPNYCPECRVIVANEIKARENERAAAKRAKQKLQPSGPGRRLIRYAGYDPRERKDDAV